MARFKIRNTSRIIKSLPGQLKEKDLMKYLTGSLINIYGSGSLVSCLINDQVYLNRSIINEAQLNLADVEDNVADILMDFNGVFPNTITAAPAWLLTSTPRGSKSLCSKDFTLSAPAT